MEWAEYYIGMAKAASARSKDSTKIGAVIVSPDHQIVSTGYNGFPRGYVDDYDIPREKKLKLTVHAEQNAIINAARHGISVNGCALYLSGLPPCHKCAAMIVNAGIVSVTYRNMIIPNRWADSCDLARKILRKCGVDVLVHLGGAG